MTGSRSTIIALIVITLVFFGLTSHMNLKRRLVQFVLISGIVLFVITSLFPSAFDALKTRAFGSEEQVEEGSGRITGVFSIPIEEAAYAGAFGYGIGATQNYVPALVNRLELNNWGEPLPPIREDEPFRVMLELGIIGYILYCLMRFALIIMLWKISLSIRDKESKSLSVAISAVLTIHLFMGGGVVVHTQNVFQWFLIGVCIALANIEALRQDDMLLKQLRIRTKGVFAPAISR
jgi:cell division protein FtsW (lipid II flippase)